MIVNQGQTEDDQLRLRARSRHRLVLAAGLIPVLLVAVGIAAYMVVHDDAPWWVVLVMVLPVLVMVGAALTVIRLQNRGHRWFPPPVRLLGTDRATRRRVRRIVQRGQLPAEEPDRGLGLEVAQATDRTRWNRWNLMMLNLLAAFQAITTEHLWWRVSAIAYLVVLLPVTAWSWRMYSRVHTLVQTHTAARSGIDPPG